MKVVDKEALVKKKKKVQRAEMERKMLDHPSFFGLSSMPSLKPPISVELSWSFAPGVTCIPCATNKLSVTGKGVMCGGCLFVCWENYGKVKKSCFGKNIV